MTKTTEAALRAAGQVESGTKESEGEVITKTTGLASVYIKHSVGFFGHLRPCYDSAADARGNLTEREVSMLRSMIARYIRKCEDRRIAEDQKTERKATT
jgi:hypothetical protein